MTTLAAFLLGCVATAALFWLISRRIGFRAQTPEDYANGPTFNLREHLNGPIACDGIIYGPTGRVSSRFTADFDASWDGNSGRMTEHFRYDSGTVQDREWNLTVDEAGNVLADADDLVGQGTGIQSGSSVRLNYRIRLPESAGGHELDVVDWMYLLDNGTIVNRSQFRKFGIKVAELVATMRPDENRAARQVAA
jgi:hypothetical protein